MKRYYDLEYDRIVDESVPKKQYEWFKQREWFEKTYEEFLKENFLNEDMTEIPDVTTQVKFNKISEDSPTSIGGKMNCQNKINVSGERRETGIPTDMRSSNASIKVWSYSVKLPSVD